MIAHVAESLLPVASWILFASLKSSVIIPLVLLARRLCARWLTPQGRYGLWFAVIAGLAIPYGAQVRILNTTPAPTPARVAAVSQLATTQYEQPIITIRDAPTDSAASLPLESKGVLIWLLGIAGLAGVVLRNAIRFRRITSGAAPIDAATDELFRICVQHLNIRRAVRVLETVRVESPLVVGYWQPTLLLPQNFSAQITSEQLRLVLLHELAHVRRHDILVNWLATLVQIAHWFNPLAWFALRTMRDDMEQACDATVLRLLAAPERIEYGNTLIRMSDFKPGRMLLTQSAGVIERHSQLKERVHMIAQFKPRGAASSLLAAALLALTAAVAVTQAANAPPPQPAPAAAAVAVPVAAPAAKPEVQTKKPESRHPPAAVEKKASPAPKLESALVQINYAKAEDLASFIKSASGLALLSAKGSIRFDEHTNMILVIDSASNVSTVRQVIATLDVPQQNVMIEAYFALVDVDVLKEMTAAVNPDGKWSPTTVFGPDAGAAKMLEAAAAAHRAEIISAPRIVIANRGQASMEQSTDPPRPQDVLPGTPAKGYRLGVTLKPTVQPDKRVQLEIDTTIGIKMMVPNPEVAASPANATIPAIDTRPLKYVVLLDSGGTALLDVTRGYSDKTPDPVEGRRLVAFVTPRLLPMPPVANR